MNCLKMILLMIIIGSTASWQLNTNINIKKTLPTQSSLCNIISSSIISSLSLPSSSSLPSLPSLSPSVLKMLKSDSLNKDIIQIKSQLLFSNLILANTKPYRSSSSSLSLSILSSFKTTTSLSLSNIYEKIQLKLNMTKSFLISLLLSLISFIKSKLGIKDVEIEKKEVIAINQDKDIKEGRKWTTSKIKEIEQREELINPKPKVITPKRNEIPVITRKYTTINNNNNNDYKSSNDYKPSLPKRTYSSNFTESDMEKFWPPTRFFNMTNGPGERIMKQNVPLIVPNAVKQIATENISKIESLASEIKALSQENISEISTTLDPIIELEKTIEANIAEVIIDSSKPKYLDANLTVDVSLSDITLDVLSNLTTNNLLSDYNIIDLSSKINFTQVSGLWKLEEKRIVNGIPVEPMFDMIFLGEKDLITCQLSGSKPISWKYDEEKIEFQILRGTSSTEYVRDNANQIKSVKITRPPMKGPYDRLPTMVNYRGYLLGDRIIGDIFTSSYSMGNITSEVTSSGKFQLQRYSQEEINQKKKSIEVKENLRLWSEIRTVK